MKLKTKLIYALGLSLLLMSNACSDFTGGSSQNPQNRPDITLTYCELLSMLEHYDQTKRSQIAAAVGMKEDTRVDNLKITFNTDSLIS